VPSRASAARSGLSSLGGHGSAARRPAARVAVASVLNPQQVPRLWFRARICSWAGRPSSAVSAHSGPLNSGDRSAARLSVARAAVAFALCSQPGSPIGVPCSALQRGGPAQALFNRPPRAPELEGLRLGGEAACCVSGHRPCSDRSRLPDRGRALGTALGRAGSNALQRTGRDCVFRLVPVKWCDGL